MLQPDSARWRDLNAPSLRTSFASPITDPLCLIPPPMRPATSSDATPWLSVIVPTLDEARTLPALLGALREGLRCPHEIVVADGGSSDGTCRAALAILDSLARLSRAAERHAAGLLVIPAGQPAPAAPRHALAFRLRIDAPRAAYRVVEWGSNLRSRWLRLPFGDQGLVVSRAAYDAAGGYPPWPLKEDVALVSRLARTVGVRLLPADLVVSARRWERDGIVRRTLTNWWLLARYALGAPPERLARRYPSSPAS